MSKELLIPVGNSGQLAIPEHLRNFNGGVGKSLMEGVGGMFNRIGLKGNRFRMVVSGQEVAVRDENYVDVVIVGAAAGNQRIFYDSKYSGADDNSLPTCYSVDGKTPAENVVLKQSHRCDVCPKNEVGSAMTDNGKKTRACGFFRRLAVWVVGDEPDRVFALDVRAMGLFGDSKPGSNQYSLNDYAKWCSARGIDPSTLVTRISFDTDQSVPKLLFKPAMFITNDLVDIVGHLVDASSTHDIINVNMRTADGEGHDNPAPLGDSFQTTPQRAAAPAAEPAPTVVQSAPRRGRPPANKTQEAPVVQTAPTPRPVQQAAPVQAAPVIDEAPVVEGEQDLADLLKSLGM